MNQTVNASGRWWNSNRWWGVTAGILLLFGIHLAPWLGGPTRAVFSVVAVLVTAYAVWKPRPGKWIMYATGMLFLAYLTALALSMYR